MQVFRVKSLFQAMNTQRCYQTMTGIKFDLLVFQLMSKFCSESWIYIQLLQLLWLTCGHHICFFGCTVAWPACQLWAWIRSLAVINRQLASVVARCSDDAAFWGLQPWRLSWCIGSSEVQQVWMLHVLASCSSSRVYVRGTWLRYSCC